jgi:hypothetical protein
MPALRITSSALSVVMRRVRFLVRRALVLRFGAERAPATFLRLTDVLTRFLAVFLTVRFFAMRPPFSFVGDSGASIA